MKCRICKQEIKAKDTDVVLIGKSAYYHRQCYIDRQSEKLPEEVVSKYVEEGHKNFLNKREKKINEHISGMNKKIYDTRDEFVKWIYETYDISVLPANWFMRMNDIEKGKAKDVSEPISSADLLDMFKRKRRELENMTRKIKFRSNYSKFLYHFKVILNKYDSYKAYKAKISQQNSQNIDVLLNTEVQQSLVNAQMQNQKEDIDLFEGGDEL